MSIVNIITNSVLQCTFVAVKHMSDAVLFGKSRGLCLVPRCDGIDDDIGMALGWCDERVRPERDSQ